MNVKREVICRLCLKDSINKFREIDEAMEQMFDILLLKLDVKISKAPIVCQDCLGLATKCLSFKSSCINTEKIIHSYLFSVEQVEHSIKAIYDGWKQVETVIDEDLNICRICMARLEKNNFVCMETVMDENMFKLLSEYIPEMDFNIIEDPVICATCRESLQSYLKLTLKYQDTEEKIKAYCREEGTDSIGQVVLEKILQFLLKHTFECPQKCAFKEELNTFETTENAYLDRDNGLVKHKELDIEEEDINLMENSYESLSEIKFNKCDMFHPMECSIETKSNVISLKTKKEYDNEEGTYKKKIQANMVDDSSIRENVLEIKSNNSDEESVLKNYTICEDASKTKENNINRHVSIRKSSLNRHGYLSVRKDILQIRKHKCPSCVFESKSISYLRTHMLIHKNPPEVKMSKCSFCTYETKHKSNLATHTKIHKDPSEIKMHKCSLCAYESRQKPGLERHMLVHKDPSEIKMHMCSFCAYESKHRSSLKRHMLAHMDSSEMYKCSLCAFESKLKLGLDRHMLVHKNPSEIKMHKCSLCAYEAKRTHNLKKHMLVHKVSSEIEINKCSICAYKSNKKCHLEEHMLRQHNKLPINKKS